MSNLRDISVQYIKGVGPARKKILQHLGIESVEDLLYFMPRRYEDRRHLTPLAQVKVGEFQLATGKVVARGSRRSWYTKKHVYETMLDDGSGRIVCVWFNQPYLENYFQPGRQAVVFGKVEIYKNRLQMVAPEYEILESEEDQSLSLGRIVPIYSLTKGISQRYLRKVTHACLEKYAADVPEVLPVRIRNKHRLRNIKVALMNVHFPSDQPLLEDAQRRISFEEFFLFQLSVIQRRNSIVAKPGIAHKIDLSFLQQYAQAFSFKLTGAQDCVIREIAGDMQKPFPMLRLLQGDVGSGKTLVALFGCVAAYQNGRQAVIMAPTEILARQHFQTIREILALGPFKNLRTELLIGSGKKNERAAILNGAKKGDIHLLVGTHALLSEGVELPALSFVVIDEQHKFGVQQRALLSAKGTNPDVLVMTATPIPRTLSLTLFGDLDVSIIDEMPAGRGKVSTKLFTTEQAQEVYQIVRAKVAAGQQAYIVYPLIEESEKLDLKAAQSMLKHFAKNDFKWLRLALLHGQMGKDEAAQVMRKFKDHELDILIATTVLEVGVDVPNAGVMVIEHAERFGLSQLHQLRGRIGRGKENGVCLLVAEPATEDGQERLKAILSTTDGFKIAEEDLRIRGPGHYFGRHQHGLNELRFVNPITQIEILEVARKEAQELTQQDPKLKQSENIILKNVILKRYPGYLEMVEAG